MLRVQHERVIIRRATYSCSLHLGTVHLLIMHNAYQLHKPFLYAKRELLVNKKTVGYSAHQEAYLRTWFASSIIIEAVQLAEDERDRYMARRRRGGRRQRDDGHL